MLKIIFLLLITIFAYSQIELTVPVEPDLPDNHAGSRSWRAPIYKDQKQALGWSEETFQTPEDMKSMVQFWVKIYSKYTTDQGVIHDSEDLNIIYEEIDFSSITNSPMLSQGQKYAAKEKMAQNAKDRVIAILKKLETVTSTEGLSLEEKRIWDAFSKNKEENKFKEAQVNGRLRFQLGQADRMEHAIFYSGRYLEKMETIFREKGLPIELTRLPFVESSFNVFARSKVGASGLWQIMRATGKGKLKINKAVDNRNHPMEATKLASKILADNFRMLESWPLAITGYNHGAFGVKRIAEGKQTRDIAELTKISDSKRSLGFASRNFYACFLAALEVEKNALRYFPNAKWSMPLDQMDIELPKSIRWNTALKWFENDEQKAQLFNPHILQAARNNRIEIPKGTLFSVPTGMYLTALNEIGAKRTKEAGNP